MNPAHRKALDHELTRARAALAGARLYEAMAHLERAHVLGQSAVVPHVVVHALMFQVALRRRMGRAALGQLARIVLGALGSAVGRVPIGNTGGSDVSMFAPMPIAPELRAIMEGRAA